jgi:hypothetical protein
LVVVLVAIVVVVGTVVVVVVGTVVVVVIGGGEVVGRSVAAVEHAARIRTTKASEPRRMTSTVTRPGRNRRRRSIDRWW